MLLTSNSHHIACWGTKKKSLALRTTLSFEYVFKLFSQMSLVCLAWLLMLLQHFRRQNINTIQEFWQPSFRFDHVQWPEPFFVIGCSEESSCTLVHWLSVVTVGGKPSLYVSHQRGWYPCEYSQDQKALKRDAILACEILLTCRIK